jgi:hypothetical protein
MKLLEWTAVNKGALVGRAKIWLPPGLEINSTAIFEKGGRGWAQFPADPLRDQGGQPLSDASCRIRYRISIRRASRELQDRFSAAAVELVCTAHPRTFAGASSLPDMVLDALRHEHPGALG